MCSKPPMPQGASDMSEAGFEFALERKFNDMHRTGCTTTCTVFAPIVKWSGLFCDMRDNGPHARTSPSLHRNAGRSPGTTPPDGLGLGTSASRKNDDLPVGQQPVSQLGQCR